MPDAHIKDDSGQGPPSHWYGWVRTGWSASGGSTPGIANCQNWTSTSAGDDGTIARLSYDWTTAGSVVAPCASAARDFRRTRFADRQ